MRLKSTFIYKRINSNEKYIMNVVIGTYPIPKHIYSHLVCFSASKYMANERYKK